MVSFLYESLRQLVYLAINPLVILPLLILLAVFYHHKAHRFRRNTFIFLSILYFMISSTGFVSEALMSYQESFAPPMNVPPNALILEDTVNVIVLGSGARTFEAPHPVNTRLYSPSIQRLVEGVRILKQLPGGQLITSGPRDNLEVSQAELVAQTAHILGVADSLIHRLDLPTTTKEEAEQCAAKMSVKYPLIVVTSANHLRRATRYFERVGFDVYPAPTDFRTDSGLSFWERCIPQWYYLRNFVAVQKEMIGLLQIYVSD